jgi:hypothetical protein
VGTADPQPRRSGIVWRCVLAVVWLGAIALTCGLALRHRPAFAEVGASAWIFLVVFTIPAAGSAIIAIRTPAILVVTALVAGFFGTTGSWSTLRNTMDSTAAVGVISVPVFAFLVVSVGYVVDRGWRWAFGKRAST